MHLRKDLKILYSVLEGIGWKQMLSKIKEFVPGTGKKKVFLILSEGWVYEGYIDEIVDVLTETDYILTDFYIVSPDYDWCASYCEDGGCLVFYENGIGEAN